MTGTKTGKGGFEVDGKVYDFDPGDPTAAGSDFGIPDHGDINVDNSKKDLSKKTKVTLGKYLSDSSKGLQGFAKGVPNRYPIDAPTDPITEVPLSDTTGNPTPLGETSNTAHFADSTTTPQLNPYSAAYPSSAAKFKKGKKTTSTDVPDGHKVLSGVKKVGLAVETPDEITTHRNTVLASNRDKDTLPQVPAGTDIQAPGKNYEVDLFDDQALGQSSSKTTTTPKETTKITLHDLVKLAVTKTSGNKFPVQDPGVLTPKIGTSDDSGNPTPIADTTNTPHFADQTTNPELNPYSPHFTKVASNSDPTKVIKKGKKTAAGTDGNELLHGVKKDATGPLIDEYRNDELKGNIFTEGAPAVSSDNDISAPKPGFDMKLPDGSTKGASTPAPDVSLEARRTKAASVTKGDASAKIPNAYPVKGDPKAFSLLTDKTLPTGLEDTVNDPQFVKRSEFKTSVADVPPGLRQAGPEGARHGKSSIEDASDKLVDLGKGKQGKNIDGNTLLPAVGKDKQGTLISGYTSKVLANNRFTADAKMSDDQSYRIGGKNYNAAQLKSVGVMLSLRGSQEFPAAFQSDVNPQNAGSVAGALIPSPNQLGVLKVPGRLLEARDALENMASNSDAPSEFDIAPLGHQSWGALNNVEEPWAGMLNLGMVAMALALQVALLLVFEGLGALISVVGGGGSPPSPGRKPDGTYTKGSWLAKPAQTSGFPPNLMSLLGIHGTRYPFGDALKVGASAFFVGGDKAKEGVGSQIVGALTSAVGNALSDSNSSGYLIIVSRTIVRAGQAIAAQISKIGAAFASNPISGIKAIVGLLEVIKQSKLIAAINIFTVIGDAILNEDDGTKDPDADPNDKLPFSSIDAYDADAPGASVRKNRLKGTARTQKTKLAWASNRAPASYLLPDSIATMALVDTKLGGFKGPMGISDADSRAVTFIQTESDRKSNGSRLPRQSTDPTGVDVKKMEAMLESEYMPFYFHDLRTNEIVSFHAFLASLTDDYTANWETVEGYGRVDPVKIYKSTGRRVGMSFYVIATSKSDFDEMWIKLNKLTTLVYPQYTKGRTLTDGTTAFTQPFSQLIGASPLIRIRLGDLLRSNYSRFALARLFGAGDGDMKLDGDIKFEGAQGIIEKAKTALSKASEDTSNEWHVKSPGWAGAMEDSGGMSVSLGGPSAPDQAPVFNVEAGDLPYIKVKVKKKMSNGNAACEVSLLDIDEVVEAYGFDTASATIHRAALDAKYNNEKNPTTRVVGGEVGYAIPYAMLSLTKKSFKKILADAGGASAITNIDKLSTFLDIEKNALVKSFRAIQGKGLGGVIESMNFDWFDKVTWEIDPNSRAPKMCKVTLGFVPIHDISPGIDHLGYNRAPIYPVGAAMGVGMDPDKAE